MSKLLARFSVAGCVVMTAFFTGCLAPRTHTWQTPAAELNDKALNWSLLSTNQYSRVISNQMAAAIALLQDSPSVALESSQTADFAGGFSIPTGPELKAYLVRGVHFGYFSFTELKFDLDSKHLLVVHAAYDGEMLLPFIRDVQEPTALIIFLPQPPSTCFAAAYKGGDWIFRGKDFKQLDRRR